MLTRLLFSSQLCQKVLFILSNNPYVFRPEWWCNWAKRNIWVTCMNIIMFTIIFTSLTVFNCNHLEKHLFAISCNSWDQLDMLTTRWSLIKTLVSIWTMPVMPYPLLMHLLKCCTFHFILHVGNSQNLISVSWMQFNFCCFWLMIVKRKRNGDI